MMYNFFRTPPSATRPFYRRQKASPFRTNRVVLLILSALMILVGFPATPTTPALAQTGQCKTSGELLVATDAAYPPFENVDTSTNQIVGFDIDLLNAIAASQGFTVNVQNAPFDTIFINLAAGQYDLVISAATITEERQKTVSFSDPYFVAGQVIIVREADKDTVSTSDDLIGKKIGVQLGTTGAEAAKGIKDAKVSEYPTFPEAAQALANGDVDAVVNDNATSLTYILNTPDLNLVVVGEPFTTENYGIAVGKDCGDLLAKVNAGLADAIASGKYAEIYRKYFGSDPSAEFLPSSTGAASQDSCKSSGELLVASDAAYPPFESVDTTTNQIVGFDIDLLNSIATTQGFTVNVQNAPFDTIFINLAAGQYDLVISAATITEERQKTVSFSDPYFVAGQVIIVREADKDTVSSPDDLIGKKIGVQLGTTGAEAAKGIKDAKVSEYPTFPEAAQALANGDVDAVVNDNATSLTYILNTPESKLVVVGAAFTTENYGIAVRKECGALLTKINAGLVEAIASGEYAEIYRKYFGENPSAEFLPKQ
ncbi:MAG: basic amino acid ABC transporter substrate-binding protein [Anaerolineae bacterium]|nr:basic amino acid ABC transporter substrate-binding protein [Anaerolineae bacterium]